MHRMIPASTAAGVIALTVSGPASAASDINIAAIATGRLYVVGMTERPYTAVQLDHQFDTESDEHGRFQYELVYHPVNCIVTALIEGKVYEAVVSNCGEQVMPGTWLEPKTAFDQPALLERLLATKPELPLASFCLDARNEKVRDPLPIQPATPAPPVFTVMGWADIRIQISQPDHIREVTDNEVSPSD